MIDTIRCRIPLTKELYTAIQRKSVDFTKYDNDSKQEIFRISKNDIPLGSFDRKVSLFVPDEDTLFLEFSVPKFYAGQNVYLITFPQFIETMDLVFQKLKDFFGIFPELEKWEIMRLDLCYAWKYQTEQEAEIILDLLHNFDFGRKKKSTFDTSVMYVGATYSLKFYLKHPEFYKHDFKILRDLGHLDMAYKFLEISTGVLRFEVTLRKKYLEYHFGKDLHICDLTEEKLCTSIIELFNKYMSGFNVKYKTKHEIQKILNVYFGKRKGSKLYMFYIFIISEGKKAVKEMYAPSTVYQYLRELRQAGIPLSYENLKEFEIDISIPSNKVVNQIVAPPARGATFSL